MIFNFLLNLNNRFKNYVFRIITINKLFSIKKIIINFQKLKRINKKRNK